MQQMQEQNHYCLLEQQRSGAIYFLHVILIQSLTRFRIVFGLRFLRCNPVETIHPRVEITQNIFRSLEKNFKLSRILLFKI